MKGKGNKEILEILNEALKLELGAINQYWLHFRLLDNWGYTKLAKKERAESIEEMAHADKIVDRIIYLEGHPNLQHVAPLMIGQDIKEVLECDLKGEKIALEAYARGRDICRKLELAVAAGPNPALKAHVTGRFTWPAAAAALAAIYADIKGC